MHVCVWVGGFPPSRRGSPHTHRVDPSAIMPPDYAAYRAGCEEALRTSLGWSRYRCLARLDTQQEAAARRPCGKKRAWVTLLSDSSYFAGVNALFNSLVQSDTEYPLIVMVTQGVPAETRVKIVQLGEECQMRSVEPLPLPRGTGNKPKYACAHFADCWTKLRMWEWDDEFERLVYLDADMLVLKNIDELLEDGDQTEPESGVGAVLECFCPVLERKPQCGYHRPDAPPPWPYFNAGLLALRPDSSVLAHMLVALEQCDLSTFPFAEQDFLNQYFAGRWRRLPWVYNASKALYACHRNGDGPGGRVWRLAEAKNLHFTMAKPWNLRDECNKGYERLNEIWHCALVEPRQLTRHTLKAVMQEKRQAQAAHE